MIFFDRLNFIRKLIEIWFIDEARESETCVVRNVPNTDCALLFVCVCVRSIKYWLLTLVMIFQVAFGAIALTVHETHEKVVNFTFPISVQAYGMLIPRPKELSRLYLFIAPFSLDVSIIMMIFFLLFFTFFFD